MGISFEFLSEYEKPSVMVDLISKLVLFILLFFFILFCGPKKNRKKKTIFRKFFLHNKPKNVWCFFGMVQSLKIGLKCPSF